MWQGAQQRYRVLLWGGALWSKGLSCGCGCLGACVVGGQQQGLHSSAVAGGPVHR